MLFLIPALQISLTRTELLFSSGPVVCRADGFVIMDQVLTKGMLIVPLFLRVLTAHWRHSAIQELLRCKTRAGYYGRIVKKIALTALFFTFLETFFIFLITLFLKDPWINWEQRTSVFCRAIGSICHASYVDVLFLFFLTQWLTFCFMGVLFIVLEACFHKGVLGWLLAVSLSLIEWYGELPLFYSQIGISYGQWLLPDFGLLYGAFSLSFLLLFGLLTIKRKDFMG